MLASSKQQQILTNLDLTRSELKQMQSCILSQELHSDSQRELDFLSSLRGIDYKNGGQS